MLVRIAGREVTVKERVRAEGRSVKEPARAPYGASAAPSSSCYHSKWEVRFARKLDLELAAGLITSWRYGDVSLTLAKRQYHRPDFIIGLPGGAVEIAQVKGWHKNLRAGIKGLKWAAQKWPMFRWTLYRWNGKAFDQTNVEV